MISLTEILMNRIKYEDLDSNTQNNINNLLEKLNIIRGTYNKIMIVSSGYRSTTVNNNTPGAAKNSAHQTGEACDIQDIDGNLWIWCLDNLQLLKDNGIYLEDKRWTPNWVHFQIRKIPSGHRIFKAYSSDPPNPEKWDGNYNSCFND